MLHQVGTLRSVRVPMTRSARPRVPMIESLEEFAALLKPGMIIAVRAAESELDEEGPYWLLRVNSEAFEVPEDMVHATDQFEAGWLVVRGQWYSMVQRSQRAYRLLPEIKLVVVMTMIRLLDISFAGGGRQARSGLFNLSEDEHNRILESC